MLHTKPTIKMARPHSLVAHKFGGSSLANADCFRRVIDILKTDQSSRGLVVVSAMRGATNILVELAELAAKADNAWRTRFNTLRQQHLDTADELFSNKAKDTIDALNKSFDRLEEILGALAVLGTSSHESLELIEGWGETLSACILHAGLIEAGLDSALLDAREVLTVSHNTLGVEVDWEQSQQRYNEWSQQHSRPWCVVTGFVARTSDGRPTILERNGSDYSAAVFSVLANVDSLTIWGDTNGILSADPRMVPDANSLSFLSYAEACELAYFGARVIHPQTLTPLISRQLPVHIRNTFNPDHPGTDIGDSTARTEVMPPVKGITVVHRLAVVTLEGSGMIGVPGTAERTFEALRREDVSVVMISQGSSEHSICCVVREKHAQLAKQALWHTFASEIAEGIIHRVRVDHDISIIAAVGDGMIGTPGIAARLFGALSRSHVNIRAIAQGASERNISVAIASDEATRALRSVHSAFWLSPQTLSIGVVGAGNVGKALLQQIETARPRLLRDNQLDLRVRAISTSRHMWLGEAEEADNGLDNMNTACDLDQLADHVQTEHLPHAVIIDCSASSEVADHYAKWLERGIHVITPNKHAGAGPLQRYQAIHSATGNGSRFRYEATVGAGLPVISTLRDLLNTGDKLLAVDGIFSGSLAWLFNKFDGSTPFSSLVHEAHQLGYTEPDPRDDLSGTDVARKLVILAREAGATLELADVEVEALVPDHLMTLDVDQFMQRLNEVDDTMMQRHAEAAAQGQVLRYVAKLDASGKARVGIASLPQAHAFAHLQLTDNVVQFTTERYRDNPLVVQGPGAGPSVTAAGVFADLLRVAASRGAKV